MALHGKEAELAEPPAPERQRRPRTVTSPSRRPRVFLDPPARWHLRFNEPLREAFLNENKHATAHRHGTVVAVPVLLHLQEQPLAQHEILVKTTSTHVSVSSSALRPRATPCIVTETHKGLHRIANDMFEVVIMPHTRRASHQPEESASNPPKEPRVR